MSDFDVTDRVPGTTVRYGDLILIGASVLNAVVAAEGMRHMSPAGLVEYADPTGDFGAELVLDLIRWTAPSSEVERPERDRLTEYVERSGWCTRGATREQEQAA